MLRKLRISKFTTTFIVLAVGFTLLTYAAVSAKQGQKVSEGLDSANAETDSFTEEAASDNRIAAPSAYSVSERKEQELVGTVEVAETNTSTAAAQTASAQSSSSTLDRNSEKVAAETEPDLTATPSSRSQVEKKNAAASVDDKAFSTKQQAQAVTPIDQSNLSEAVKQAAAAPDADLQASSSSKSTVVEASSTPKSTANKEQQKTGVTLAQEPANKSQPASSATLQASDRPKDEQSKAVNYVSSSKSKPVAVASPEQAQPQSHPNETPASPSTSTPGYTSPTAPSPAPEPTVEEEFCEEEC
ncbi:hypothetical protein J40TS1_36760 [Paenibacillus montaniterrae]|uniref:Uncharacterized protein n=1 Tax=Paenibacillus montaniterrae TaxID=429341 RepID=A0A919YTV3_9BACL|nr:hypothetical protein [Paenibacillus montaniterrae]GIP18034.1 hypothetical protein J40TS1_36760 [Paenibacillus montaniterrae]